MADNAVEQPLITREIGGLGYAHSSGFVTEEFLPELKGEKGRKKYREMADNDPTIGAILVAIDRLVRAVQWTTEKTVDTPEAEAASEWLWTTMHDMEGTWSDFISDVLSMLVFGFSYFEIVYKYRGGLNEIEPWAKSKHEDGTIGLRRLALRPAETLYQWMIADNGDIQAFVQMPADSTTLRTIPKAKALHFKTANAKGNPEGRSILRNAYRSYHFIQNLQIYEAIAYERNLNGIPLIRIPSSWLNGKDGEYASVINEYMKIGKDTKRGDQTCIIIPSDTVPNPDGTPSNIKLVEVELLSAKGGGGEALNANDIINRHKQDITRTVLADFLMLGAQKGGGGSYALSKSKTDLFLKIVESFVNNITETLNRQLVPKLWELNAFDASIMPEFKAGKVAPEDLTEMGDFLDVLSRAGIMLTDEETEDFLREISGLPIKNAEV